MSNDIKEQMKTSREHYELMQKQIEEDLKKIFEGKLQKVTENAIGTLALHGPYGGGNPWTWSKPDIKREDIPVVCDSAVAGFLLARPVVALSLDRVLLMEIPRKPKGDQS